MEAGGLDSRGRGSSRRPAEDERRTKRALEWLPGLEFRQGLVNDVRMRAKEHVRGCGGSGEEEPGGGVGRTRVTVETVFGEMFEADTVVLAVGLGLGGRVESARARCLEVVRGDQVQRTVGAMEGWERASARKGWKWGPGFLLQGSRTSKGRCRLHQGEGERSATGGLRGSSRYGRPECGA